jgi:serine kinase of HPr protein (carbohydrate metabolism regulator)
VYALLNVCHLFIQDDLTLLSTTASSDIAEQFPPPTQEIEEEPMEVEGGAKHITSLGDFKEVSVKKQVSPRSLMT